MKDMKVKVGEFVREKMTKEELEEVRELLKYYKNKESEKSEVKNSYNNKGKRLEF